MNETINSKTTASEAIRILNLEREDQDRVERVTFGSPQLLSLTEAVVLCQGTFDREDCRNELDPLPANQEICPVCDAHEERAYQARREARDAEETRNAGSQYRHLRGQR